MTSSLFQTLVIFVKDNWIFQAIIIIYYLLNSKPYTFWVQPITRSPWFQAPWNVPEGRRPVDQTLDLTRMTSLFCMCRQWIQHTLDLRIHRSDISLVSWFGTLQNPYKVSYFYERFEPRSHFKGRLSLIVRVNVVLNRTVVVDSDWRFHNLCGSHLQSQSELYHVSWWYYTLVIDLISQLRRNVIGRLSVKQWCYWLWRLVISNVLVSGKPRTPIPGECGALAGDFSRF